MAHHACCRLHDAEAEQDSGPDRESTRVALDESVLHRATERIGHERLGHHPDDAERDAGREYGELPAGDPDEQSNRRARVGPTGVGVRQLDHAFSRASRLRGAASAPEAWRRQRSIAEGGTRVPRPDSLGSRVVQESKQRPRARDRGDSCVPRTRGRRTNDLGRPEPVTRAESRHAGRSFACCTALPSQSTAPTVGNLPTTPSGAPVTPSSAIRAAAS